MLLGRQMLIFGQYLGVDGIIVGMKDRGFIPGNMGHQLTERFGGTITNS